MPSQNSKPREDNRFQPFPATARSSLQNDVEVQNDNRLLVALPDGEVLRLVGQRKCLPCLTAKKGACLVNPHKPQPCLNCIRLNRQDRCKFKGRIESNTHESTSSTPRASLERIAVLESEIVKLNSVVSELKSALSNSSVQTALFDSNVPSSLSLSPDALQHIRIFPDRDEIYKILSVYKPLELIGPVAVFLLDYFTCKNTAIRNFRVSTFKGIMQRHDADWLMLQWDESELESEVFAIFKVNTEAGLSSTLVHSGHGGRQPDGRRWATSCLAWWVLTMGDLRELLVAGQQVLEVMNWADPEMVERFFDPTQTECSIPQLALYAEMLYPALSRLGKWLKYFDSTSFLSEQLSRRAVILGDDGRVHSLFQASVQL